jgi:endoglucanase Acf2
MKLIQAVIIAVMTSSVTMTAQTVAIGKGSYGTVLPPGTVGPRTSAGAVAVPKVSAAFHQPVQTSDFWSSLIFPYFGNPHSNNMFAHPLNYRAINNGMMIGHTPTPVFAAADYLFPFSQQLTVGVAGLNAPKTVTEEYGDWTVTALWDDGSRTVRATIGHGLPFAFFTITGGNASIASSLNPTIWYNQKGVVGVTVDGRHYGIFGPDSSVWTGTTTLLSSLNGKNYFSVALLPDNSLTTLEFFRTHAYAFVTGSRVSWQYNETSAVLTSTYSYTTDLKESGNGNLNQTLTALYRHQWLNTSAPVTNFVYPSVAGTMKVHDGNQFTTELIFEGVLPALPDQGDYNPSDLTAMINAVATEILPDSGNFRGTYWNGKLIARFAHLVNIADQRGAVSARDHFLTEIKKRLEDWLTAGGKQQYIYNTEWKTLTGYPSEFGADNQINDHNFHSGYSIMGAAIVAQYDSIWAAQANWGGMVDLLIRDGNNYDRNDTRFPFLRSFDPYAGHSWESGHGDFGDGNNEESSSESMNFATAVVLWGAATGQKEVRDLGIYLYVTERSAIEQYWFDIDNEVFPVSYPRIALGMVWGAKGVHSTWFGNNPDFIHGINMLPFNGGSLYLGRHPDYVQANYNEMIAELNGKAPTWKDITWQYLSLTDPAAAVSLFLSDPSYIPEDGESKAHTYHWLYNMKKMGRLDVSVTADIPTYSVLKNSDGKKTYIAYNPSSDSALVKFSDGFDMKVPPRTMRTVNTANINLNAPVAQLITDKARGKIPLVINFTGSKSFDRNGSPLSYSWNFGDGTTSSSADTVHSYSDVGVYTATLTVTNQLQISSRDSIVITVLGNGTPYFGLPVMVPALIQAENYDKGGEGVAYHDNDANNIGLAYRPNEGVDLEASNDQGFNVYWMTAGEWIEYTIQVPTDGNYHIIPNVATVPGFGNLRILIDNADVSGKKPVLNTGGWQNWKPIIIQNVPMKAGKHILRIDIDTDTPSERSNWLFSLNSIQVTAGTAGIEDHAMVPVEFSLDQNYPNPFNPSTSIRYAVPVESHVSIDIFNTLGQNIFSLVNQYNTAGWHTVQWMPFTASGLYFYTMTAVSTAEPDRRFTQSKKMVFIK